MSITLEQIDTAVCERFNLTVEQLHSRKRRRGISRPRQIAMLLARELTSHSYPQIGKHFALHHTSIIQGERSVRAVMQAKPKVAEYVSQCREAVRNLTNVEHVTHRTAA